MNRYYVGYTSDLDKRLKEHNTGMSTFTAKANDWVLLYKEAFESKEDAHKRELEIKKRKSEIHWIAGGSKKLTFHLNISALLCAISVAYFTSFEINITPSFKYSPYYAAQFQLAQIFN